MREAAEKANERIQSVGGGLQHALVQAVLAECLVAQAPEGRLSAEDWKTAHDLIESARLARSGDSPEPYFGYVEGLVLAATPRGGDSGPAATRLVAAFETDSPTKLLSAPYRRKRAADRVQQ